MSACFLRSHVCDVIEFRDDHARMRIDVPLASFARFERARIGWISYVRLILKLLQICVVSIATRLWRWNFLTLWIGCSYVASCKWGMRATKIRLLFAVFSVCFVIFYFRSVSSCSASSSNDCTKLVGELHPDSYLRFCVCSTNNTKDCKYVWLYNSLFAPLDDRRDRTN